MVTRESKLVTSYTYIRLHITLTRRDGTCHDGHSLRDTNLLVVPKHLLGVRTNEHLLVSFKISRDGLKSKWLLVQ